MKLSILTMLCKEDEPFLDPHIRSLRAAYGEDVSISISGDDANPPSIDTDYTHHWTKSGSRSDLAMDILFALLDVANQSGADGVIKTDCDTFHFSRDWTDPLCASEMVGFQMFAEPSSTYGAAYCVSRYALFGVTSVLPDEKYDGRSAGEDEIVTNLVRRYEPNGVFLHPFKNKLCGWVGKRDGYQNFDVVHCGQNQQDRVSGVLEAMDFLSQLNNARQLHT